MSFLGGIEEIQIDIGDCTKKKTDGSSKLRYGMFAIDICAKNVAVIPMVGKNRRGGKGVDGCD